MADKYIKVNGVLKLNPDWLAENGQAAPKQTSASTKAVSYPTTANPNALTCSYNFLDAQEAATAVGTTLAPVTVQTMDTLNSPTYINKFQNPDVTSGNLMDGMEGVFNRLQVPIGMSSKLIGLQDYDMDIVMDDSGSMDGVRWTESQNRVLELLGFVQFVPTGKVTLSFLDRSDTITIYRRGQNGQRGLTPQQFYEQAAKFINNSFSRRPTGGTPIWRTINKMLRRATGKTAHYLITDGTPNSNDFESSQEEIEAVKNLLINRWYPQNNPFTLLCCSTDFTNTLWMHEVEEIACRPGKPGFIAALRNFSAEQVEVLNDQGAWFPYSRAAWLICNLVAALNPNDLDAFDQHAPLTKYIIDNVILGRVSTQVEYLGYFVQHPNAMWLFKEDYKLFLEVQITNTIPSVNYFETLLGNTLSQDIARGQDSTEPKACLFSEDSVFTNFNRPRPRMLYDARQEFWNRHYINMEQQQLNYVTRTNIQLTQNIWIDYLVMCRGEPAWQQFIANFYLEIQALVNIAPANPPAPQAGDMKVQEGVEGAEPPPPAYEDSANVMTIVYTHPQPIEQRGSDNYYRYYTGYVAPAGTYSNETSSSLYKPQRTTYQSGSQYGQQQYDPSCCRIV